MIIEKETEMLFFRFNNYRKYSFYKEHLSIINEKGCVWMLKVGKRSSMDKLTTIAEHGGWLVLRSPKSDGSKSYLAKYTKVIESTPTDACYPAYYQEVINEITDTDQYYMRAPSFQWFRIISIEPLDNNVCESLVVSKTGKKVDEVIKTTRTAVMFIKNDAPIELSWGVK